MPSIEQRIEALERESRSKGVRWIVFLLIDNPEREEEEISECLDEIRQWCGMLLDLSSPDVAPFVMTRDMAVSISCGTGDEPKIRCMDVLNKTTYFSSDGVRWITSGKQQTSTDEQKR